MMGMSYRVKRKILVVLVVAGITACFGMFFVICAGVGV
jgi:hypothetical protein